MLTASDVRAVLGLPPELERESVSPPDHGPDADDFTPETIADIVDQWRGVDEPALAQEPSPVADGSSGEMNPEQDKDTAYRALHTIREIEKSLGIIPDDTEKDDFLREIDTNICTKSDGNLGLGGIKSKTAREEVLEQHIKELEEMIKFLLEMNNQRLGPNFRPIDWLLRLFGLR